jgi:hypothetical protein
MTSASGSPNRTLNSITFGPRSSTINPANSNPRKGEPLSFIPRNVGTTISLITRWVNLGVTMAGGE